MLEGYVITVTDIELHMIASKAQVMIVESIQHRMYK